MAMEEWPHDTQELPQVEGVQPIEGATGSPDWTPGRHHLLQHPFLRILMASCVLISIVTVTQSGLHILRGLLPLAVYYGLFAGGSSMVLIVTYSAYVRLVEGRTPDEVMAAGAVGELAGGALVGAGLVAAIVGSLWLVGAYIVTDVVLSIAVAGTLATDLAGGLVEEILFRAVLFRIGRELIGTRWALLLSALLFGLVHADTSITFAVACLGGLLFGCAYILTERVWMAAGIHIAWDFTQGGILGVGVSQASLVHGRIRGSIALTGGSAGIEGSLIALAIVGFAAVTFLTFALRRERIALQARLLRYAW